MRIIHSALSFVNGVSFRESTTCSAGLGETDLSGLLAEGLSAQVESVLSDDSFGGSGNSAVTVLSVFAVSSGVRAELMRHILIRFSICKGLLLI